MMFSNKLEDIPSEHYEKLIMFLNDHHRSDRKDFNFHLAAEDTNIPLENLRAILSQFCEEEVLRARINLRCPNCDTDYGRFDSRSEIPGSDKECFSCDYKFEMSNREAWEIVYSTKEVINQEDVKRRLKKYVEQCYNLNQEQIESEFEQIEELNPQKRGRLFDYFVGLLFLQIEGVKVRVQQSTKEGEVDVLLMLSEAEKKLRDTCGTHTLVENKWESTPIEKSEIGNFHDKLQSIPQECYIGYFLSMSGFTSGAQTKLDREENPTIISWEKDDIEEMVYNSSLKDYLLEDNLR